MFFELSLKASCSEKNDPVLTSGNFSTEKAGALSLGFGYTGNEPHEFNTTLQIVS